MDYATNSRPLLQDTDDRETDSDAFLDNAYAGSINASSSNIPDAAREHATETRIVGSGQQLRVAPSDKYNYTYLVFYLMGMTTMVPWNFFVTAEDYWQYKFRNVTTNNTSQLTPRQLEFQSDLSIAASVPGVIFLILNASVGHKIPLHFRMIGSLVMMLLIMIGTTALVRVNTDQWQDEFFHLTMLTVVVINSFSAILTGGLFGIAGQFSANYMTAAVSGQALGGIFSALANIITLIYASNPSTTAFVFFTVGCLVLLFSLVAYIVMSRTLFFKYYSCTKTLMKSSLEADPAARDLCPRAEPRVFTILGKIWLYGFVEWLIFVTTLSIYPAVTVLVGSQNHGRPWNDVYFLPVVNYLLFNTGDYLGRVFAGMFEWPWNNPILIGVLTIARIAFVPAMLLCNITQHHNFPVLIHSDYMFIVLMAAFALSNGYLANIALIGAPRVVEAHEKEMASSMMAAFLGIGLACGSAISLMIIEMIK
ncbi:equilibrative nucleoside transporter 2-like [Anopheles ziemanni]|uniref:equilibrative nucleoside transporter 2 n=1 Tax=Anopheles coustani TaxID=139045 RepID=UPI00265AE3A9|nr:equilibrative nucleoside transporter 2 [Anopheles coustani]XP_058120435.1 equilibrative nucleoside transporter 2 [Anopheles coustani]XP_058176872.1 equilibrative nucleoside transporter 2-like [Anopheles ziemanni]